MPVLERVPPEEVSQIDEIIRLMRAQLEKRYPNGTPPLRAQHAKDHACVRGTLKVVDAIPPDRRRGIFVNPGQEYQVWVRYSNAAATIGADSMVSATGTTHGSRGMAIKILGVRGSPLIPTGGQVDQDFLMVNHPVFPFANVEDYEAITRVLATDQDEPGRFFADRIRKQADGSPDVADPMTQRALRTLGIIKRIQSLSTTAQPPAYQPPPATPLDNQYFACAPFLFGEDAVMRVRVTAAAPAASGDLNIADSNYLRTALLERLTSQGAVEARIEFQAQIRAAGELAGTVDTDIEDASAQWDEAQHPFETLAILAIPPQDFDTAERRAICESLSFSPWHGISDHRPLGGINRLRRAVYEASAGFRRASAHVRAAVNPG